MQADSNGAGNPSATSQKRKHSETTRAKKEEKPRVTLDAFFKPTTRVKPELRKDQQEVRVVTWNANGIRARIRKKEYGFLLNSDGSAKFDIVCIQETKALPEQIKMPAVLSKAYPYQFSEGTQMRKGQSGTAIWSRIKPVKHLDPPITDVEGRICAVDFGSFVAVAIYTPNSGTKSSYRTGLWHAVFSQYIDHLQKAKPTVLCLDSNVCPDEIDIYAPGKHRDKVAGFYNIEREQFRHYLSHGYVQTYRVLYPTRKNSYTWFNSRVPAMRERNQGWKLDHILLGGVDDVKAAVQKSDIMYDVWGSDHLPMVTDLWLPTTVSDPVPSFSVDWLEQADHVLERLAKQCKISALSREQLHSHWYGQIVGSDEESDEAEEAVDTGPITVDDIVEITPDTQTEQGAADKETGVAEKEGAEVETTGVSLKVLALFAFAVKNLDGKTDKHRREQTRHFFHMGRHIDEDE